MTQLSSVRKPQADHRLGQVFWGIDGAPAAFDLTRFAYLPPELQLQERLLPEVWRSRRQAGWESSARKRRVFSADRAALAALAISEREAGRFRAARRVQHLHDTLGRATANLANIHFDSRVRNCFGSHVLAAVEALAPGTPTACYTLLSTTWIRPLPAIDGSKEPAPFGTLRAQLYRAGLSDLSGWCIVGAHGEHQLDGTVHRHPHALVVGEKAQAFEALRDFPEFKGGRGAAGLRATTWLKDNAAFAERVSARDELLSFAEAYGDAPIKLADEELREIRDLLDPVTGHAAFEIGAAVGRAILLEAADGGAKGARSWRLPAEVYLPKAIDKDNPNWPNAAAGLTGLHWVLASYEDRVRTGLGRQKFRPDGARSRGARNFLMLLGCEVGPRLVVGAEPNRRSARRQASMNEAKASSIPKDVLSPDLERVLRAILDTHRPKRERRDRALALLRTLSRDWNRRLRDAASVEGWHEARVYRHPRGRHTAHWLARLQETAWIPVGRERFRLPGEAAIRTPETQAMYRTEDFVAGLAADEIDADFAQALGLTAHARVSDIVALLEEMRDGVQPFDLSRIRLVYQQLARVAPRGWSPMVGDLSVHTFRARFNSGVGLVLVIDGNGSAEWRRPGQVRRGRQVLPDRELYVIDDSFRALWSLLHVGETNLEDCCEYLRAHAARVGPTEEDGLLIQVYRYMAGLLRTDGAVPSPSVRHVPLACTQDWRARRPILLVENADLRARLAAARPELFFWRPSCDTRSLGALVDALSVTRLAPAVRPLSDQRSQEAGEDLTETFRAAVDHLSDTLGRASAGVRSALLVAWDELKASSSSSTTTLCPWRSPTLSLERRSLQACGRTFVAVRSSYMRTWRRSAFVRKSGRSSRTSSTRPSSIPMTANGRSRGRRQNAQPRRRYALRRTTPPTRRRSPPLRRRWPPTPAPL